MPRFRIIQSRNRAEENLVEVSGSRWSKFLVANHFYMISFLVLRGKNIHSRLTTGPFGAQGETLTSENLPEAILYCFVTNIRWQ